MYIKILLIVATACSVHGFSYFGHDYQRTSLGDTIDKASMRLLNELYKSAGDKNVITSPLGLMMVLSMYLEGAGPQTKQQISQFLGGGEHKQITESFSDLSRRLSQEDPSFFTMANKIYVSNKYTLADLFSSVMRRYDSEVESLNFTDPTEAAAAINRWAEEKTRGHIKDPVDADSLDPETVAVLCNVIFFQGHWDVPFQKSDTQDKDFHIDNSTTVKKPTMHLLRSLFYTENENLGARMIELPYREHGFRMVVVLPNEMDGLPKVLEKAAQTGLMNDVFNLSPAGRDVDLYMPKFEVKNKLELNDILRKVGVEDMFTEGATEVVKNGSVVVSKAFQEAFIKVDEEGATAGAFTGVVMVPMSSNSVPPPPLDFKLDRPFLYMILNEDKLIFAGTYTH